MIKRHTSNSSGITPPAELEQFFTGGDAKDSNDGALVRGSGEDVAFGGEGEKRYGCFVGRNNVDGREGKSVEEEDFAGVL